MKKLVLALLTSVAVFALNANASEEGIPLDKAPVNVSDHASLQNGAKLFVNYCLSCHSAAYMRYNRLQDIGFTEQQIKDNLLFTTDKVGDLMKATLDPAQAKAWLGTTPPDLTVIARSRDGERGSGADYLYTFLRTFYVDGTKATGWNNLAFPNAAMPHVLWQLQGQRVPVFEKVKHGEEEIEVFKGWKQLTPGTMTEQQYDQAIGDLVNYLQWMGEPAQSTRVRVGVWVMLFLLVFTLLAWRLNKAFWKEVQ